MNKCILVLLSLLFHLSAFAQDSTADHEEFCKQEAHQAFLKGYRFFSQNLPDSGLAVFEKQRQFLQAEENRLREIHYYSVRSGVYARFGFFEKALESSGMAGRLAKKHLDDSHYKWGVIYGNYAFIFNLKGEHDRALDYMRKAQDILILNKETRAKDLMINTFNLATKALQRYDIQDAKQLYEQAESFLPYLDSTEYIIHIKYYTKRAKFYIVTGKEYLAKPWMEKAIDLMDSQDMSGLYNARLKHDLLAFYYLKTGDRKKEIHHRNELYELYKHEVSSMAKTANLHNMARAYEYLRDFNRALDLHNEGIELQLNGGIKISRDYIISCLSKVSVLRELGRFEEAYELCESCIAKSIDQGEQNNPAFPGFYWQKAELLDKKGKMGEVQFAVQKYIDETIKQYSVSHFRTAEAHFNYAKYCHKIGLHSLYNVHLNLALKANRIVAIDSIATYRDFHLWDQRLQYDMLNFKAAAVGKENLNEATEYNSELHLEYLCDAFEVLQQYVTSINSRGKKYALFEEVDSLASEIIDLAFVLKNEGKEDWFNIALSTIDKANSILLREHLKEYKAYQKAKVPDSTILVLKSRNEEIDSYRAYLAENPNDSIQELLTSRIVKVEQIKKRLGEQYPIVRDTYMSKTNLNVASIQSQLKEGQCLITFYPNKEHLYCFYIHKGSYGWSREEWNLHDFSWTLDNFRIGIDKSDFELFKTSSFELYETLIAPFQSKLNAESLIIIPNGLLSTIPFECLLTEKSSDKTSFKELPYLIKKHELSYAFSIDLFFDIEHKEGLKEYLGVHPDYGDQSELLDLESGKQEIEIVADLFDGEILKGVKASERCIRDAVQKYRILHFATHSQPDIANPFNSKMLLSCTSDSIYDDVLYSHELLNLPINADLVVLNACSTGDGGIVRNEGVMSLGRSFKTAGANSVLMNLWDVSDKASGDIIQRFFENLKHEEQGARALHKAKLHYLQEADDLTASPKFWASALLVGNMENIAPVGSENSYFIWLLLVMNLGIVFLAKKRRDRTKNK
jgi:CHAT domain-containing protein